MHSLYSSTVEATRIIVDKLTEQGFQLVTVSELLTAKGLADGPSVWFSPKVHVEHPVQPPTTKIADPTPVPTPVPATEPTSDVSQPSTEGP